MNEDLARYIARAPARVVVFAAAATRSAVQAAIRRGRPATSTRGSASRT